MTQTQNIENPANVEVWDMSDVHHRSVTATNNTELKGVYADWTPTYDKDVMSQGYKAPLRVPELAMEFVRKSYSPLSNQPLRILDAGCGTGLSQDILNRLLSYEQIPKFAIGADLSDDMLCVAEKRACFDRCIAHDLNTELPADWGMFDLIISSGLFLEGHCGPKALANCLRRLAPGGHAVISIRKTAFDKSNGEFDAAVVATKCEIVDNVLLPYLGPVEANFMIMKKL